MSNNWFSWLGLNSKENVLKHAGLLQLSSLLQKGMTVARRTRAVCFPPATDDWELNSAGTSCYQTLQDGWWPQREGPRRNWTSQPLSCWGQYPHTAGGGISHVTWQAWAQEAAVWGQGSLGCFAES